MIQRKITLIVLLLVGTVLLLIGQSLLVSGYLRPYGAVALVLVGCGILVLAVAAGLLIDRIRDLASTGALTWLTSRRVLGIMCIVLMAGLIVSVETIDDKNDTISSLNSIVLFQNGRNLLSWYGVIPWSSYMSWNFSISYAGVLYIEIWPTESTYARVIWNAYGYQFDQQINSTAVGGYFYPTFIAFPGTVKVIIGNNIPYSPIGQSQFYTVRIDYKF